MAETTLLKIPRPTGGEEVKAGRSVLDAAFDAIDQKLFRKTAGKSGERTTSSTSGVALTGGPELVIPSAGNYVVDIGGDVSQQAEGTNAMVMAVFANGSATGLQCTAVGHKTFDGGSIFTRGVLTLGTGAVLTIDITCINGISALFKNGFLSIEQAL